MCQSACLKETDDIKIYAFFLEQYREWSWNILIYVEMKGICQVSNNRRKMWKSDSFRKLRALKFHLLHIIHVRSFASNTPSNTFQMGVEGVGKAATRKLKEVERGLLLGSVPPPLLLSPSSQLGLENRPSSKRLENRGKERKEESYEGGGWEYYRKQEVRRRRRALPVKEKKTLQQLDLIWEETTPSPGRCAATKIPLKEEVKAWRAAF